METSILIVSVCIALVFFFVGLSVSWKTSLWIAAISFLAYVLSFRHTDSVLRRASNNSLFYRQSSIVNSAVVFFVLFFIALIIATILYHILWKDSKVRSLNQDSGWLRFSLGLILAVIGWEFGLILVISALTYLNGPFETGIFQKSGVSSFLQLNVNMMIQLGKFFSTQNIPSFLQSWLIN